MKKIGVLLSGCGNMDGSEIHESVLTLLYIDMYGGNAVCIAPDTIINTVVNHADGKVTGEKRNLLSESARIARGKINNILKVSSDNLDAIIIPGGSGPVKNLSNYASDVKTTLIDEGVKNLVTEMHSAKKPIGAICIAPALIAKILQDHKPLVTIGDSRDAASKIESFGGIHQNCSVDSICIDEKNRLVTTPAYMKGPGIKDIAAGIEKLVKTIIEMA
jgi:enhancing lycopene biosynthesis protein 2